MHFNTLMSIAIASIFVNNFVLSRFLGICPFLGVSKRLDSAIGMGLSVIFVMTIASIVTFLLQIYVLVPYKIEYLQTITFILVIAALVQMVEMFIQKTVPLLYQALGIYLPLITTNCAILGVTLLNVDPNQHLDFMGVVVQSISSGIGFTLALIIMAGIRERLELNNIPKPFQGATIAFITAALLSLSFLGFAGLA